MQTSPVRTGTAKSGELELYYEDMGDPTHPPVLLIMGLGAQLLLWPDEFCQRLVDQGLRVIRFDNRDVGLSSKLDGARVDGSRYPKMLRSLLGLPSPAVYTLEDLADDAIAVLDHLEIESAEIVGASMGGMIAQIVAAQYPHRTRSLAVIFSSNNRALLPPPRPKQLFALLNKPKDASVEAILDNSVRIGKLIGSPGYPATEAKLRADAVRYYERCYYPAGVIRHFGAVLGSGSLRHHDRRITAPTVVIHGLADKLMPPSGGRAVARAIPDARLVTYPGMAHDLPEPLWDSLVATLRGNFAS